MLTDDEIQALRDWCDTNLDTDSFEGMHGAKEAVEKYAADNGLDLVVRWDQKRTHRGLEHVLVIEDRARLDLVQQGADQWLRSPYLTL